MFLVKICEQCGRQFEWNSEAIEDCIWCNRRICIYCEVTHEKDECEGKEKK
jgi:hypothetical protein